MKQGVFSLIKLLAHLPSKPLPLPHYGLFCGQLQTPSQSLFGNKFSTKRQFVVWYKCLNTKPFGSFYIYFSINCTFKVYISSSSQTTEALQFQWTIACHRHNAKAWPNRESGERRRCFALVQFSLLFLDLQSRCLSFFCKLYYL